MKVLIQHGNAESEYSDKDLLREAQRVARKANAKLDSYTLVVTSEGPPRLKVLVKPRTGGILAEFIAL